MEVDAMAGAGSVYLFNLFGETLQVSANGLPISAGEIPGWNQSGGNKYQPACQPVPMVRDPSEGAGNIIIGRNTLSLMWEDGFFAMELTLDPSQFPLSEDLILLVAQNKWQLLSAFGVVRQEGAVAPPNMAAADAATMA